jgi:translocation and assembly module TamB
MFVGREFRVEEMRAASGGGVLTLSGGGRIAADDYEFRLDGRAQNVRVRYPTGITSVVDGDFVFSGGTAQRLLSGEVVILRLTTARTTTLGSLLAALRSGSPTAAQSAPSDSVQLNVHIASAPGVEINTSLIRNVAAGIDLRLVGTLGNPSLLGQINVSQGQMTFHGSRYQVNRGEIEFRNPIRIEPLLDFELETRMRGVDIALILAGPARRLNVSYRSDPPLSFSDLVNLVAVGRAPTTDPLSVSRQRIEQQSLFQTGANNVLAQAVQSPVSPGLQRFFGVSRLKVDPAVGGAEANPAARISTEQQLTDDITLIYTYDLSSSQQQTARLEWTPNRRWTLVVTRDENGLVGSDAIYKTRRP